MIDSALALPLYHQVAGILRQRIEEGVYLAGVRLNSEDELAVEFDVSRATVRQAMGELASEGLVVRRRGRGHLRRGHRQAVLKQRFRGSLSDLIAESGRTTTRDVTVTHDAVFPAYIGEALRLPERRGTIARRTRMMDGEPFCYTVTYLPAEIGEKAVSEAGLRRTALLKLLLEHGIALHSATQSIRAQLADPEPVLAHRRGARCAVAVRGANPVRRLRQAGGLRPLLVPRGQVRVRRHPQPEPGLEGRPLH